MQKRFILLPLVASILTACSANSPAPVENAKDSNVLSPSLPTPVEGTSGTTYGWQSDIQPSGAPVTPVTPTTATQPNVVNPVITEQPAQPTTTTKTVKRTKTVQKKVDQNLIFRAIHQYIAQLKKASMPDQLTRSVKAIPCS